MTLAMIRRSALVVCAALSLQAADTVQVVATVPTADEQGLVPGKVTFIRSSTSGTLSVNYRLAGTARSTKHGGHVAGATLTAGIGYTSAPVLTLVPGGIDGQLQTETAGTLALFSYCTQPGYGYLVPGLAASETDTSINVTSAGTVTVTDVVGGLGSGAVLRVAITGGGVSKVAVENGGSGWAMPTITITAPATAGSVQATGRLITKGGVITGAVVTGAGSNYYLASDAVVTVSDFGAGLGSGAAVTALVGDGKVVGLVVTNGGSGYATPTITISGQHGNVATAAQARAVVDNGVITEVEVTSSGAGYGSAGNVAVPTSSDASFQAFLGGAGQVVIVAPDNTGVVGRYSVPLVRSTGAGVGATVNITGFASGAPNAVGIVAGGTGYAVGDVLVPAAGYLGTGATFTVSTTGAFGAITGVAIGGAGTGYGPEMVIDGYGTGASAVATVVGGQITAVTVTASGSGYGTETVVYARMLPNLWPAVAAVRLCGPDYVAPSSAWLLTSGSFMGQLKGTITFNAGESSKELVITPRRNAVGGGRTVVALVDAPAIPGQYSVGSQSSATVTINDADDQATVRVQTSVAYPKPPITVPGLPIEVQGRAEWRMQVSGDPETFRSVQITVAGDSSIGPTATQCTSLGGAGDYLLVSSVRPIEDTVENYLLVHHKNTDNSDPLPGPGATTIGLSSEFYTGSILTGEAAVVTVGDVVCFENPTNEFNGVYLVTAYAGPSATTRPTITIFPAMRKITTSLLSTRVRRLGQLVQGNNYTRYSMENVFYFYGIPWNGGNLLAESPRGRLSMSLNFVQNSDYRILSPAAGSTTLADTSVVAGLRFGSNASKPNTAGYVDVVLNAPFPAGTDVLVPFMVMGTSTATIYNGSNADVGDYTLNGVDTASMLGQIKIPGGQTSVRLQIQPRALTPAPAVPEVAETVELALVQSPDFQIAPQGTSPINPTASVVIMPLLRTSANVDAYVAIRKVQDGAESATPTNGLFEVYLTDANGTATSATVGVLAQDLQVPYDVAGTATADSDYIALSGLATIPAGSASVAIQVRVSDDTAVEGAETVALSLQSGPGYMLSNQSSAILSITEDEPILRVSAVTDATMAVPGTFTVENYAGTTLSRKIVFNYTMTGTAVSGTDYVISGTAEIPANQTTCTFQVTPTINSQGGSVILTLNADTAVPITYTLGTPTTQTMLLNIPPTVSIVAGSTPIEGDSSVGSFIVMLSAPTTALINVRYAVSGTATNGVDYSALSGLITVGGSATTTQFTLGAVAISDGILDANETIIVTLQDDVPVGTTYRVTSTVAQQAATLTIQDNGATSGSGTSGTSPLVTPTSVPYMTAGGGGGGGGGCGVGSGLGLVGLGAGLACAAFLRRRRTTA